MGDDIPGEVRHKTYEVLIEETKDTPSGKRTRWAYLPYSMHMAGPREAIQHMMIRKNFGCTHFIVGRHGGLQVQHRRGGLLRGLRRAGLRARERPEDGHAGRALAQFGVHGRGGLRHGGEAKEKELSALKLSGT